MKFIYTSTYFQVNNRFILFVTAACTVHLASTSGQHSRKNRMVKVVSLCTTLVVAEEVWGQKCIMKFIMQYFKLTWRSNLCQPEYLFYGLQNIPSLSQKGFGWAQMSIFSLHHYHRYRPPCHCKYLLAAWTVFFFRIVAVLFGPCWIERSVDFLHYSILNRAYFYGHYFLQLKIQ